MKYEDDAKVFDWFRQYLATGNRSYRDQIVIHHAWIAERCVRRFTGRGELTQDLMQVAQIGIVKAVERFDPDRGHGFPAFAVPTVMGELRRHFRDTTWQVAVPRRSKDLVAGVNAAISSLSQELGRPPKVDDVARAMGISPEVVLETMEASRCYRAGSLDDSRDESSSVHERMGAGDPDIDTADVRITARDAIGRLDERSQRIVLWRFYEGLTQAEIGEQLGVGQVQVSRLLRAALATLREILAESEPSHDAASEPPSDPPSEPLGSDQAPVGDLDITELLASNIRR